MHVVRSLRRSHRYSLRVDGLLYQFLILITSNYIKSSDRLWRREVLSFWAPAFPFLLSKRACPYFIPPPPSHPVHILPMIVYFFLLVHHCDFFLSTDIWLTINGAVESPTVPRVVSSNSSLSPGKTLLFATWRRPYQIYAVHSFTAMHSLVIFHSAVVLNTSIESAEKAPITNWLPAYWLNWSEKTFYTSFTDCLERGLAGKCSFVNDWEPRLFRSSLNWCVGTKGGFSQCIHLLHLCLLLLLYNRNVIPPPPSGKKGRATRRKERVLSVALRLSRMFSFLLTLLRDLTALVMNMNLHSFLRFTSFLSMNPCRPSFLTLVSRLSWQSLEPLLIMNSLHLLSLLYLKMTFETCIPHPVSRLS